MAEQLAHTPAEVVVANEAFFLVELAVLHLSSRPPNLDNASLAIDGLAGMLEAVGNRLGEPGRQLVSTLAQLRMAFVETKAAVLSAAGGSAPRAASEGPSQEGAPGGS